MSHTSERAETSVQTVALVPIVFLLVAMCFHVASLLHQRDVAQLAASRGAQVASGFVQSSTGVDQARREIETVVNELGSRLAGSPHVRYRDQGVAVTVNVQTAQALSFLPSVASAEVWRPLESFRLEPDRR